MDDPGPVGSLESAAPHDTPPPSPDPPSPGLIEELRGRAQTVLARHREHAAGLEARIADRLGHVAEVLSRECADRAHESLAGEREAFHAERQEWESLRDQIEQGLESLREKLQGQADAQQARGGELADAEAALAAKRQDLARWAAEVAEQREQVEAARRELQQREEAAPAAGDPEDAQRLRTLSAEHAELRQLAKQLQEELAAAAAERDAAHAQVDETTEKFRLALDDVSRQRERLATLEQELASRPEAGSGESAELAGLRAEREELLRAIEELKSRPEAGAAGDNTEDLQRRFELAVEDVRELKSQNAALQDRLRGQAADESASQSGGMDWEAQKRRLLASLEGEPTPAPAARQEERAKIEGTIRITDEVIAQKEQRINELEASLRAATDGGDPAGAAPGADPDATLGDDERLAGERQRLAELEQQWQQKLREAELELSVQRAKIAREHVELADLRSELMAAQRQLGGAPVEGKGQRRWLNKLGLGGAEEA